MFIWDTIGEAYLRSIGYQPKENLNETFTGLLHRVDGDTQDHVLPYSAADLACR